MFDLFPSQNSIGETQKTILVSVVRLPRLEEDYKVKEGSELVLPCVQGEAGVSAEWRRGEEMVRGLGDIILDRETGGLVILSMTEDMEGEYSCRVVIGDSGEERVIRTQVRAIINIIMFTLIITIITGQHHAGYCPHQEQADHN